MPNKDPLKQLDDALRAIPAAEVRKPSIPMSVFNQQGHDLVELLEQEPELKTRLTKAGLPSKTLEQLPLAIAASQKAESSWQAVFSPRRPEDVVAFEDRAAKLRSDVVAALRWNLRGDRIAQGTLDAIQDGEGAADLVQDLDALAVMIEQQPKAFAKDQTFDPKERAKACRETAKALRDATSGARADLTRAETRELRDRAYTYADDLLDDLRECARYAFRHEPALLVKFQDHYLVRATRRSRRRSTTTETPAPATPVEA